MHMPHWNSEEDGIVEDICNIEIAIAVWDGEKVIGSVIIIVSIFHHNMIFRVYLMVKRIEAAVAWDLEGALDCESAVVKVVFLYQIEMNENIRRDDVAVLHVSEELCSYLEVLLMMPVGQGSKLNFICRELSHC